MDSAVAERRAIVEILARAGVKYSWIAEALAVPLGTVARDVQITRQRGIDIPARKSHPEKPGVSARRERVLVLWGSGFSAPEIAKQLGFPVTTIERDLERFRNSNQISKRVSVSCHPSRVERRERVLELYQAGIPTDEIAARLGIDRRTIHRDLERLAAAGAQVKYRRPSMVGGVSGG